MFKLVLKEKILDLYITRYTMSEPGISNVSNRHPPANRKSPFVLDSLQMRHFCQRKKHGAPGGQIQAANECLLYVFYFGARSSPTRISFTTACEYKKKSFIDLYHAHQTCRAWNGPCSRAKHNYSGDISVSSRSTRV